MFRKVDLHIHSPASDCYVDHMMPEARIHTTSQDIIAAARRAGLEAIAITDHNTVASLDDIRRIASEEGIHLFPGMEISARGGHILALFDNDASEKELYGFILSLGFTPEQMGFGYQETPLWLDEVCQRVEANGGLAIAAHIDRRPKGFVAATEISNEDKQRIYTSPHLGGLEITIPQNRALWVQGQMPGYSLARACIQGSDAHAPEEVGRRPIYVDLPRWGLDSLRQILRQSDKRLLFPQDLGSAQGN